MACLFRWKNKFCLLVFDKIVWFFLFCFFKQCYLQSVLKTVGVHWSLYLLFQSSLQHWNLWLFLRSGDFIPWESEKSDAAPPVSPHGVHALCFLLGLEKGKNPPICLSDQLLFKKEKSFMVLLIFLWVCVVTVVYAHIKLGQSLINEVSVHYIAKSIP